MTKTFDFKITAWERVTIDEQYEEELLEAIKKGEVQTSNDVYYWAESKGGIDIDCEVLDETVESMSLADNGNQATIDVMEEGESVWDNEPVEQPNDPSKDYAQIKENEMLKALTEKAERLGFKFIKPKIGEEIVIRLSSTGEVEGIIKGQWKDLDIRAKKGTMVRYTGKHGYPHDIKHANRYLKVGETYTVSNIDVDDWERRVYLKEFPAVIVGFNSVHFEQFYPNENED